MAFDGIVTKAIASELQQLIGARIDKIYQPNKDTIIIGIYCSGINYALNICTNSQNYRINLTTHSKSNPQVAPNFCMLLRKYLIGLRIKNFITNSLERIITIELEGYDDIDDIINLKLIIELMGKHCNIILVDEENIIIDCLRHINSKNATSEVIPHIKYTYPISNKNNFLEISNFDDFKSILDLDNIDTKDLPLKISNTFNGFSKSFVLNTLNKFEFNNSLELYNYFSKIIDSTDSFNLSFEKISTDYFLILNNSDNSENFSLNFFIDDFYYNKETSEEFKNYRNTLLRLILDILNKYNKRLDNINNKLKECDNMELYKLYGELITANLYKIQNQNIDKITLENYYDNNNPILIPLDKRFSPSINAKRFFKKYHKLKNALDVVSSQKQKTLDELNYIESIVYELENTSSLNEVLDIFEEISENDIFKEKTNKLKTKSYKIKKSKLTKNKFISFNPIKYNIDGYTFLVGKNNKENDYLTLKYSKKTDIWFHTKDIHGCHAVLSVENGNVVDENILLKCAEITAFHSKAKNSSNVPVDFCEIKYVKKPNGAKPGMVIYSNNKTLYVNPKIK